MTELVRYEVQNQVATVTLDAPHNRNALTMELLAEMTARITGHVRAAGMGIVGACDMAVADGGASFAFSEARVGVAPAIISLTTLDLMEPRAAARYYLTGETFSAAAAAELGLITVAAPDGGIDTVLGGLLASIRETSPQASTETKRILNARRRQRIGDGAAERVAASARLFASPDTQEGIHAFLERRPPQWPSAAG